MDKYNYMNNISLELMNILIQTHTNQNSLSHFTDLENIP